MVTAKEKAAVSAWVATLAWPISGDKVRSRSEFVVAPTLTDAYLKMCAEVEKGPEVVVGIVMASFAK